AARKIGGRDVSRPAFWFTTVAEVSRVHGGSNSVVDHRHWRDERDFQRRQRRCSSPVTVPRSGTAGPVVAEQTTSRDEGDARFGRARKRLAGAGGLVLGHRGVLSNSISHK